MTAKPRRRMSSALPRALAGVVVVLLVALGGPAAARWSGTGSGSGSGASGSTTLLTLTPGTPTATLYPGGQGAVVLTITNPDEATVKVGSLQLRTTDGTGGYAVDAGHAGCAVSALSYTTQTNGGAGWTVSGQSSLSITLPGALTMATNAAAACQGATFTVYLRAMP